MNGRASQVIRCNKYFIRFLTLHAGSGRALFSPDLSLSFAVLFSSLGQSKLEESPESVGADWA